MAKMNREFARTIFSLRQKHGRSKVGLFGFDDHITNLFTPKSMPGAIRSYGAVPTDPFPGILATDREQLNLQEFLAFKATELCPANVDEKGRVYGNGVRADFYGLLHVGGVPQERATVPNYDNAHLREEKGLSNSWQNNLDRRLFRTIVKLFLDTLPSVTVKIKDRTSAGFPGFQTDVWEKTRMFLNWMEPKSIDQMIELIRNDKFEEGYRKFGWFGPAFALFRDQTGDKVTVDGKKRTARERNVSDPEYAITGGRSGKVISSSKSMADLGMPELEGRFFGQRRRVAYALSAGYSFWLLPFAQSVRKHVYDKYSFTMHHTTKEQKRSKFSEWDTFIAVDVSDHDILWPIDLYMPEIVDVMTSLGYEDWIVKIFETAARTAIYVPAVAKGEGGFMVGDWTKPSNSSGLLSGNPFTDILGSMGMIFNYLLVQLMHTMPQVYAKMADMSDQELERWVDYYLQGLQPISAPSKSDDAYLLWKGGHHGDTSAAQKAEILQAKMEAGDQVSPYMLISYENGGAFLGDICLFGADKELDGAVFISNANSYYLRMLLPEYPTKMSPDRGLYEPHRLKMKKMAFRGLAHGSRPEQYGTMPTYNELTDLLVYGWKKYLEPMTGFNYFAFMDRWFEQDQIELRKTMPIRMKQMADRGLFHGYVDVHSLTPIELEFLNNPDVLDYKARDGDIRNELIAMNFGFSDALTEASTRYLDMINPTLRRFT